MSKISPRKSGAFLLSKIWEENMFEALGSLLCNTIKIADAVVSVPLMVVNAVVVKPVAEVATFIKKEIE